MPERFYRPTGKETQSMPIDSMIEAEGLKKSYGETAALAGIDLDVPAGSILGLSLIHI